MQRATITGIIGLLVGFLAGSMFFPMTPKDDADLLRKGLWASEVKVQGLEHELELTRQMVAEYEKQTAEINKVLANEVVPAEGPLDVVRTLEIAKRALAENDNWTEPLRFEVEPEGDGWLVFVARLPQVPGGHRMIKNDATGKVTDYHRGE